MVKRIVGLLAVLVVLSSLSMVPVSAAPSARPKPPPVPKIVTKTVVVNLKHLGSFHYHAECSEVTFTVDNGDPIPGSYLNPKPSGAGNGFGQNCEKITFYDVPMWDDGRSTYSLTVTGVVDMIPENGRMQGAFNGKQKPVSWWGTITLPDLYMQ